MDEQARIRELEAHVAALEAQVESARQTAISFAHGILIDSEAGPFLKVFETRTA